MNYIEEPKPAKNSAITHEQVLTVEHGEPGESDRNVFGVATRPIVVEGMSESERSGGQES